MAWCLVKQRILLHGVVLSEQEGQLYLLPLPHASISTFVCQGIRNQHCMAKKESNCLYVNTAWPRKRATKLYVKSQRILEPESSHFITHVTNCFPIREI